MNYKELLCKKSIRPYLLKGRYGLEKECQRVTINGQYAGTDHPKSLGSRSFHPYIQTDFSENQLELITPVADSIEEMFKFLAAIHDVAYRSLPKEEMLWPLSLPPALPEKEEDIMIAKLENFEDVLYRRFLARMYGKRKQMVSGIHFNFEFGDQLLRLLFENQQKEKDFQVFKTQLYLTVTRNYLHYRWFLTYFFGATPVSEANYFVGQPHPTEPVRSIRNSEYGYTNHKDVKVSYRSLTDYLSDIAGLVESGKLSEEKEFYAPVRLRGGKKVADLAEYGIRYIELRNIDLNPFEKYGVAKKQIAFIQFFLLFLLGKEEELPADQWVHLGDEKNNQVALEHPLKASAYQAELYQLLDELSAFAQEVQLPEMRDFVETLRKQVANPEKTLAGQLYLESQQTSQKDLATKIARKNYQQAWEKPYQLAGFREMELSTQIFMFDAIQKGVWVEVLDESDQFLKLTFKNRVEYVKNANMTSKDRYIVPLIMANKTVTKKILASNGYRVPLGLEFTSLSAAIEAYEEFAQAAFVVKPKTTNYGLGISIFKDGASLEDYKKALNIAFSEDSSILIEEYLKGTEYRFFVIDGKVKAVLLRIPANVVGDGVRTISELVSKKNDDPLRGTHHRTPLELIQLGELEKLMLHEQGYQVEGVPEKDAIVYLRENSNISTGGDSIDITDTIPKDYKELAAKAVSDLGAKICGIDLIIPDLSVPADEKNAYGIIEANFNPAMHMHMYPYSGLGQRLTLDVLYLLYPELQE